MRTRSDTGKKRHGKKLIIPWLVIISLAQGGCYLLTQGTYLLTERSKAVSIETLMKQQGNTLSPEEFIFFSNITHIRNFSEQVLELNPSKNYTTYIQTDKKYLAAVVSAAGADSLDPYLWHFPLVGSVPYKGFYNPEGAGKEAAKLDTQGYDTWIRAVDAFSTLGITRDPLYSFMVDYPIHRLAEIMIHEQVHATIWIHGQAQFNEEIASFIGEQGARDFLAAQYGTESEELRQYYAEKRDRRRWLEDIGKFRERLDSLYSSELPLAGKLQQKDALFRDFRLDFRDMYENRYETELYRAIPDLEINNAFIALFSVYYGHNDLLERLYVKCGNNLQVMINTLKGLESSGKDPYTAIKEILGDP